MRSRHPDSPLGRFIREKLAERDITQKALAKMVGMCPSALCGIISGTNSSSNKHLKKIAIALGVNLNELEKAATGMAGRPRLEPLIPPEIPPESAEDLSPRIRVRILVTTINSDQQFEVELSEFMERIQSPEGVGAFFKALHLSGLRTIGRLQEDWDLNCSAGDVWIEYDPVPIEKVKRLVEHPAD